MYVLTSAWESRRLASFGTQLAPAQRGSFLDVEACSISSSPTVRTSTGTLRISVSLVLMSRPRREEGNILTVVYTGVAEVIQIHVQLEGPYLSSVISTLRHGFVVVVFVENGSVAGPS